MSWLRRTAPPWRRKRREHLAPFISLCRAMEVLHADVHKLRVAGMANMCEISTQLMYLLVPKQFPELHRASYIVDYY
jgi:hypothetical protein